MVSVEEVLSDVWAEVLRLDRVDVHSHFFEQVGVLDNFFAPGGTSLLIVQVRLKLRDRSATMCCDLFCYPTVRTLATHLSQASEEKPGMSKARARAKKQLVRQERRTSKGD